MKYLQQFLLLMAFVFAGEAVHAILPLPIPASIWGLLLLLCALLSGVVKLPQIEDVSKFFLAVIPVLFVVPAVGVLEIFGDLTEIWPVMLVVIGITYLAAMASTGWLADWMIRMKDRRKGGKK